MIVTSSLPPGAELTLINWSFPHPATNFNVLSGYAVNRTGATPQYCTCLRQNFVKKPITAGKDANEL